MLFFEDEIQKARKRVDPSGLRDMTAQDPRMNGQLRKHRLTVEQERKVREARMKRLLQRPE
ncbi:hypothetical protein [Sporosarcina sp. Te-1]|uniref:hypothetical protein n=1 Tax=Sporosarcina sp. Te-1 TaxID=2818390 RepID=UPI001A9FA211|nr:hypothetical protein [Sporosarcina sp. Te-1]QTD39935.1 hypothetical protein J3U78_13990 [Sporosarcina sp. Te-1]